jgi:hypothetical protein
MNKLEQTIQDALLKNTVTIKDYAITFYCTFGCTKHDHWSLKIEKNKDMIFYFHNRMLLKLKYKYQQHFDWILAAYGKTNNY